MRESLSDQRQAVERHDAEVVDLMLATGMRIRAVAVPLLLGVLLLVALVDGHTVRTAVVASVGVVAIVWSWFELKHAGPRPAVVRNLAGITVLQLSVVLTMGGIDSPLLPALVPVSVIVGAMSAGRFGAAITATQIVGVWLMTGLAYARVIPDLMPLPFGGEVQALRSSYRLVAIAAFMTVVLFMGRQMGLAIRRVFVASLRRTFEAREQTLAAYRERNEALTALSSEIAHELKNPLASVKGLAALIADGLEGKRGERVAVLRREVDRMQEILEELLNFSRPLVPLALEEIDVVALCREMAVLHEGMAAGRRIAVEAGADVTVACDPRKLKQILVNLLQNAIECAPNGTAITLVVAGDDHDARIAVLDRGQGLDPSIAERVFEPGITSKAHGSGLGLTTARSLARQHGGELAIGPRDGGGCRVELTLPRHPAKEAA